MRVPSAVVVVGIRPAYATLRGIPSASSESSESSESSASTPIPGLLATGLRSVVAAVRGLRGFPERNEVSS